MHNLGDEQTSVTPSISNMQENFSRAGSDLRTGYLNLKHVGMAQPHFYLSVPQYVDR